ncbi:EmrB/QacA subfamily drug resistance transporter [Elusimicrobium simillimum]|uniref:DHA2 family efflux MFS transporter permease subunit n=1 Tax=Elusimicrobium simillimum TaxID=3143438 RepID=UPI003C6F2AE2
MTSLKTKLQGSARALSWLVAVSFFMQMLDGTILNTALPAIADSMGENPLRMQSVVISYMLTVAFLIPISGWLADFFGAKRVFIGAIFIFTLGSLFCALSQTLWQLVAARIVQGVGGALMVPVGRLAVMRVYPKDQLVKALNFITIPGLIGPVVGPTLGGIIVYYVGWHWIFLINIPIGLICIFFTYFTMPKVKIDTRPRFDWIGYLLFSGAVVLISLSLGSVEGANVGPQTAAIMFIIGAFFLLAYARSAIANPWKSLFKPRLFFGRSFTVGIIANVFIRFGGGAIPFLMPLFFQTALGYSALKSGLTLIPMGITSILAKTIVERALNMFGYKRFMIYNTFIIGFIICSFALVGGGTPYVVILLALAVLGVFNSMQFTALNTLTLITVPNRDLSQANSLLSAVMQVAMSLGVGLATAALAFFGGHNADIESSHIMHSFHCTYLFVGIISMSGSLLFMIPFSKNIVDRPSSLKK